MFKLALNAGHGLKTAGKRCLASIDPNETREWSLNARICEKIEARLAEYDGIEVLRIDDPTGNTDYALKTRTDKGNNWGADLWLSIHHNAGIGGGSGGGAMVFTYTSVDSVTADWQRAFYNAVVAHTGLIGNRSNPLGRADLHECRETKMPACLIECGFMDSTTDTPVILSEAFADSVARACCDVIAERCSLVRKTPAVPVPSGYLDSADPLYGWAYNHTDDTPVEVHIYVFDTAGNALKMFGATADKYREDLKAAGIGNGAHGFALDIDYYALFGEGTYTVKAFAIGDGNPQLTGEYTVAVTAPEAEAKPENENKTESPNAEAKPPDPEIKPEQETAESEPEKEAGTAAEPLSDTLVITETDLTAPENAPGNADIFSSAERESSAAEAVKPTGILAALKALLRLILNWIGDKDNR